MEFQSNCIGSPLEFNCQDMQRHFGWRGPQEIPTASPNNQRGKDNMKPLHNNASFAEETIDLCLPKSLASESALDPTLKAGIQCWKMSHYNQALLDELATAGGQYSALYGGEEMSSRNTEVLLPEQKAFWNEEKPTYLGFVGAMGTVTAEIDENSERGVYLNRSHQQPPFEYQEQITTLLPAETSKHQILSSFMSSNSSNDSISLDRLIPWQLKVLDIPISDTSASSTKLDTTTMWSPNLLAAENNHMPAYVKDQIRGTARVSSNWQERSLQIRGCSGCVAPNSSPDDEYEPAASFQCQEVIQSHFYQVAPFGDRSRMFMFGTSGNSNASPVSDKSTISTIAMPESYSVHLLPSHVTDFWIHNPTHSTQNEQQDEQPDFTWTKVGEIPTNPSYSVADDAQLPRLEPCQPDASTLNADMLSRIHVCSLPDLPTPDNTPPMMDELINNFEAKPGAGKSNVKRKPFSLEGRQKVKLVRKNGACFSCRVRKVECSADGVCNNCLKAAHDSLLAPQVCVRNKFKDIYIGIKDIHHSLLARKDQLDCIVSSLAGTPKQVLFWVEGGAASSQNTAKLQLDVMQCSSSTHCRWKNLGKVNGIYITAGYVEDERYVIIPSSLPSVDRLDLFGRQILSFSDEAHSGAITSVLDTFLLLYCKRNRLSRLRQLANTTLRIASLNSLVAYGFINPYDGSYDLLSQRPSQNQRYVSETIHDQIRLRAAEGLEPAEKYLFCELDNLREIVGSNDHNRIIAGICLLRLAILYRERMIRDEIRLGLPRHGKRRTGHQARLEKAAFMYKRLTVVYATLCRATDSPMTLPWQSETGIDIAEEDEQILRATLLKLQAAYKEFRDEKLTQQHDDVFKALVVEPARNFNGKSRKRRVLTKVGMR